MAGTGEVYERDDGKFGFRVTADNGSIVATDGGQGYERRIDAHTTVEKLMRGDFSGPISDA